MHGKGMPLSIVICYLIFLFSKINLFAFFGISFPDPIKKCGLCTLMHLYYTSIFLFHKNKTAFLQMYQHL